MVTTIGVDPHKATHTAVAIDEFEMVVGEITIPADRSQTKKLMDWADTVNGDRSRVWAVESAGGLGYLLSQQLVAHGEQVLDVPAVLASRVRVLSSGKSDKNDPNDARSVAIAALRQPGLAMVRREDHAQVLRMLAKRHLELTSLRTQAVCRLHSVLVLLRPGGMTRRLSAAKASRMLQGMRTLDAVGEQRRLIAKTHLADIRRLDRDIKATKVLIRRAVAVSGTTVTDIYGVGPIVAAFLIGYTGDPRRFATADHYAPTTAPPPSKCPPVARPVTGSACAATANSTMPSTWPPSPRSDSKLPGLLRQETHRRQNQKGSTTSAKTAHLQRRLPAPRRRPRLRPGGHSGTSP